MRKFNNTGAKVGIAAFLAVWVGILLFNAALIGGVIYVAVHFLKKVW